MKTYCNSSILLVVATHTFLWSISSSIPQASAYITSGLPGHRHRAWLKQMTSDICQLPPGELSPEECLTTPLLLSAWAQNPWLSHRSKNGSSITSNVFPHHGKECALTCEQLLKRLIDERRAGNQNAIANTQTYNALIDVWSKSGERGAAAERAEQIVIGMQDAFVAGEKEVQPDLESFRLVLKAWSQAKGEEYAPYRAQQILDWMSRLYESGENSLVQPDADCFDIALHTWAISKSVDAPRKTEKLILSMIRLYENGNLNAKLSRLSFNQVLTAWSKVQNPEAAQRAQDILNQMRDGGKSTNHDLTPNIASYSAVVFAWCKSQHQDSGRRAERILKRAEKHSRQSPDEVVLDNVIYNLVIDAHSKTSSNKAHLRARTVLDRLIAQYDDGLERCKPDVYSFTSVLGSCASLSGSKNERRQAFEVAKATFDDMLRSGVKPNHVSYGIMIKACARLIPMGKERQKYTSAYFKDACRDGCVGAMVLDRLKEASSTNQYNALLKVESENSLPADWTANVPAHEKYSRKNGQSNKMKKTITRKRRQI